MRGGGRVEYMVVIVAYARVSWTGSYSPVHYRSLGLYSSFCPCLRVFLYVSTQLMGSSGVGRCGRAYRADRLDGEGRGGQW